MKSYLDIKGIAEDKRVVFSMSCFEDFRHVEWLENNEVELKALKLGDFYKKFKGKFLPSVWASDLNMSIRSLKQGTVMFKTWANTLWAAAKNLKGMDVEIGSTASA